MKNLFKIAFILFALVLFIVSSLYYLTIGTIDYNKLNRVQKYLITSINDKFTAKINSLPPEQRNTIKYDELISQLNIIEKQFVKKIFSIDPVSLGFKGEFCSMDIPDELVKIENINVVSKKGDTISLGVQYSPKHSYKDFILMNEQMKKEIGKSLYITSGYRSPGKQAYLFIMYLATSSNFSLYENAKWIAMPGYSQHGTPINNALDLTNENGIDGFSEGQTAEDFVKLPEYKWMLKNAAQFNFFLSYPENNKLGVAFEPWHWHWEQK